MARICMLLNNFEPPFGGPELQAIKIAVRLIKRGHKVIFIAKGSGKASTQELFENITIYRLNRRGLASIEAMYLLWTLREEFDIIHVHGVGRLASVAITFSRHYNKRVFIKVTTAGHIIKPISDDWRGLLKKLSPFRQRKVNILKRADAMISISNEITEELLQNGFSKDQIIHIPNGVDIEKFYPVSPTEKVLLRKKLGLPEERQIILFTGKITKRKGIDILLKIWSELTDIYKEASLVLVGNGQGQPDSLEEWLDKYILDNRLQHTVIRTGDVNNVSEYLMAADLFVFPSRREGLPNSLLEAMASGLTCIASPIGGNSDLIVSGKTGFCVSIEDIDTWKDIVRNFVKNRLPEYGTAAYELIKKNYSIDETVRKLELLYDRK